jgi:hypothetical protein
MIKKRVLCLDIDEIQLGILDALDDAIPDCDAMRRKLLVER